MGTAVEFFIISETTMSLYAYQFEDEKKGSANAPLDYCWRKTVCLYSLLNRNDRSFVFVFVAIELTVLIFLRK